MLLVMFGASLALAADPASGCTVDGEEAPCPTASRLGPELALDSGLHLVMESHGDGCPSMYRLVCTKTSAVSASFGNCSDLAGIDVKGSAVSFRFEAEPDAKREAKTYATGDACSVVEK